VDGRELIEAVAEDYYTPEAYKQVKAEIDEFVAEHPIGAAAPEEYRDSMIENVPLHRDIVAAWEAQ
jgi:hypothetical protein